MKKIDKNEIIRIAKFFCFSCGAGVIQIGSFTIMNELIKMSYWPAYLISLILSVLFNFTVNRKFTFKSASNVPKAMLLVFAYYLVFTPLSTIFGDWLVEDLGWNEYLVTAINMAINLVTEFLWQRFVVFRNSIDQNNNGGKI